MPRMVQGPRWPRVIEKAGLPSAAAAHGRVGMHCPPRNRWQRRTGRSGSWPRPGQHHQLDPTALALVKRDTAMSRSCQSVLRCGVEPLAPKRLSACLRCRGPDQDVGLIAGLNRGGALLPAAMASQWQLPMISNDHCARVPHETAPECGTSAQGSSRWPRSAAGGRRASGR